MRATMALLGLPVAAVIALAGCSGQGPVGPHAGVEPPEPQVATSVAPPFVAPSSAALPRAAARGRHPGVPGAGRPAEVAAPR
ncbi:hypothetical protein GCM10010124_39380 [Pilimelia terevasa]|uniref:Uncharacterized protein n=1 Tax=Pilimelia terevasa TaxID=53372 RepID=A0A8J3BQH0_9ACTN|nr:hypothetical protein GCM10010124_39380 [Pilimelia terevasa]